MKKILKAMAALGVSLACLCGGAVNAVAATSYNSKVTEYNTVISIHHGRELGSYNYNSGPIINAIMMKFYYDNPYAYN